MTRMLLYRYRTPTELSFKELLYNELYFASPLELNDPFDGQYYYEFPADVECWERLLRNALDSHGILTAINFKPAALAITNQCPISYTDLMNTDALDKAFTETLIHIPVFKFASSVFSNLVKDYIRQYEPSKGYVVSFSELENDPLMWSHYSAQHSGFCLVFRTIDNSIKQQVGTVQRSVSPTAGVTSSVPASFKIEEVTYETQPLHQNAFWLFPKVMNQHAQPENGEKITFMSNHRKYLLTKDQSWDYEREWRATIPQPSKFLGGKNDIPSIQRLFYYEPSQLVGVIFGARCTEATKERIESIILHKRQRATASNLADKTFTNFVFYQSTLNGSARKTYISPLKILDMGDKEHTPAMPKFQSLLNAWNAGECIEVTGNVAEKTYQDKATD